MNTLDTLKNQIANQIMGRTVVIVNFNQNCHEYLAIYQQYDCFYIEFWGHTKKIPFALYKEIRGLFSENKKFNTDPEMINGQDYDSFFDKFWNGL